VKTKNKPRDKSIVRFYFCRNDKTSRTPRYACCGLFCFSDESNAADIIAGIK